MAEADSRADRRDRYHRLLRILEHNSGDPYPPLPRWSAIATTARAAGVDLEDFRTARRAAVERDDVIRWRDGAGDLRVGLADPPAGHFSDDDVDALRAIIETEASRERPDQSVVGWCNRMLARIEDGGRDA